MTQTEKSSRKVISGVGWVNPLTHDYRIDQAAHAHVFADEVELVQGVDYTVSNIGLDAGYVITITNAGAWAPVEWVLDARPEIDQASNLSVGGQFGTAFEAAIDKLTRRVQRIYDLSRRSLKTSISVAVGDNPYTLPAPVPGTYLGWNAGGSDLENKVAIDSAALPAVANTYFKRSADNLSFVAMTPSQVLSDIVTAGAIVTSMLAANVLSADVAGRAKMQDGYVNAAKIFDPGATPGNGIPATKLYYLNAGANAVAQLVQAKLDTIVELEDFAGKGDDSTDNLTAFQRANTYLAANGGGCIKLRRGGIYRLSAAVTLSPKVSVIADHYSAEIRTTSATADMLVLGGNCIVRGVSFTSTVTRTAGRAIGIDNVGQVLVYENLFVGHFVTVQTTGPCSLVWVRDNSIYKSANANSVGVQIGASGAQGNDFFLRDNFIRGAASGTQGFSGIQIDSSGGTYMSGNSVLWCQRGLYIAPANTVTTTWTFSTGDTFDTCAGSGIVLNPAAGGSIRGAFFDGPWCSTNTNNGIVLNASGGNIDGVDINHPRCLNNGQEGIKVLNGAFFNILGGMVAGNSGSSSGTYSGILVAAAISDFSIIGVQSGPSVGFPASQKYGIELTAGASNNYIIAFNRCRSNVTGGISDGGTGTAKQVGGNTPDTGRFDKQLTSTATWDPASLANGAAAATTVTVTGAAVGDLVLCSHSQLTVGNVLLVGQVTSANTVTATLFNASGGAFDLASGTLTVTVFKK